MILAPFCHANQKAVIQSNGLEMRIEFGYLTGADNPNGVILDGNVYLKNISSSPLSVVTGVILEPRYSTGLVSYTATVNTNSEGDKIKPSLGVLDILELRPGEVAMLKHFRRRVGKTESKMIVAYTVGASLKEFYPAVWAGDLTIELLLR